MNDALHALIDEELRREAPVQVSALAAQLAQRGGNATAAVLYYGSTLRADNLDGVLDFYVLVDDLRCWPGSMFTRLANRVLPPNVGYVEFTHDGQTLRAKYALLSVAQFARRVRAGSLDTTIWARFCQPSLCVWSRSAADHATVRALIQQATATAARWAAMLGPARARPADFWRALFAHTYVAELRVERSGRAQDIVEKSAQRYTTVLPLAWEQAQVGFERHANEELEPRLDAATRARAQRQWARRRRLGKPLNILRLLKAVFTFEGGVDYVVWKIERHRGVRIEVSPWERRFPLLAAPRLYWRLRKRGIIS